MNDITNDVVGNEAAAQAPAEKMVPQSVMNQVLSQRLAEKEAKIRAEYENQQRVAPQMAPTYQAAPMASPVDTDMLTQTVTQNIQQAMQRKASEDQVNQIAQTYLAKMAEGQKLYPDFNEVMKDYNPAAFPHVTALLSRIDNASDAVRELRLNPSKLATINILAQSDPNLAHAELLKIGESAATNRKALAEAQNTQVPPPLDRPHASARSNLGSSGAKTISELRKMPWLRGL